MNSTTKFRPSIIHSASVQDINRILDELVEELSEQVTALEEKAEELFNECQYEISNNLHIYIVALMKTKVTLLEKQIEVKNRYTRN